MTKSGSRQSGQISFRRRLFHPTEAGLALGTDEESRSRAIAAKFIGGDAVAEGSYSRPPISLSTPHPIFFDACVTGPAEGLGPARATPEIHHLTR
jgi:hypothetical protein